VLLARALVQEPDWLLLDEFYNGLDAEFRGRVDRVLQDARRRGQSWVAAAHRAADVPRGTRGVIELRAGRVHSVKRLGAADLARLAAQAGEIAPVRLALPRGTLPRRALARRALPRRALARRALPRRAKPLGRIVGQRPEVLVRLAHVDLFVEYRAVLRDLNWELREGEHWAVFGANGAGKSSFLRLLYGDLSPALGGTIERSGVARGTPIAAWKRQVGYVAPELQTDYLVDVSVHDLVASGRYASIGLVDEPTAADRRAVMRWLKFFALGSLARRRPRELSYGQLRRALFARALAADARVLLLDEPLTGLDPRQRAGMKRLLERLMRQGLTVVMAVHHPEDLPRGITRSLHLIDGRAHRRDADTAN
jgi:molybdate transport system ATP-binding protein